MTIRQKPTHSELVNFTVQYLRSKGYAAWKSKSQGTFDPVKNVFRSHGTARGIGDVTAVARGIHVELEIKVGRDVLRPEQQEHCKEIDRAGGIYIIIRKPEDLMNDERI